MWVLSLFTNSMDYYLLFCIVMHNLFTICDCKVITFCTSTNKSVQKTASVRQINSIICTKLL